MNRRGGLAAFCTSLLACVGSAFATTNPEHEPNNTKSAATICDSGGAGMESGDTITGSTTGSSTSGTGLATADYFKVRTRAMPTGVYKYQLSLSGATPAQVSAFGFTIRGLSQSNGMIGTTDSTLSIAIANLPGTPTGTKSVQWYGFGPSADLFVRVTGSSSTTSPYTLTLIVSAVAPATMTAAANEGQVTVEKDPSTSSDTDFWVYTSAGAVVPTFGNDDPGSVTRETGADDYIVGISDYNTANNQPSPADDLSRNGVVLDFPGFIANGSSATGINCNIRIISPGGTILPDIGPPPAPQLQFKMNPFDIVFFSFSVHAGAIPTDPSCMAAVMPASIRNDGVENTATFTVTVTPGANPTSLMHAVWADLSTIGGENPAQFVEGPTNTFTYVHAVAGGVFAAGAYPITAMVRETSPMMRSSTCTTTLTLVNPPDGACCVDGVCRLATRADCSMMHGMYDGDGSVCTNCTCEMFAPENDICETARDIAPGDVFTGNTCLASAETFVPMCDSIGITSGSVWFKTTGTGNIMTFDLCGSAFDTLVSVYCGECGSLTCVASNDDAGCGSASRISWCSQSNAMYFIAVHGFGAIRGAYIAALTDGGSPCTAGVTCVPTGACCFAFTQECVILSRLECESNGGVYSGDNSTCFSTGSSTLFSSSDPFPLAIPDFSSSMPGMAESTIEVGPGNGSVSNLAVLVGLSHSRAGDLIVTLSHGATSIDLASLVGDLTSLDGDYVFTDSATTSFPAAGASGFYLPARATNPMTPTLSGFDGQDWEGTWRLTVLDNQAGAIGSIGAFSLVTIFSVGNCTYCPPCSADYNEDGGVDGGDVGIFFQDWESSAPCADVNADGGVDGADVGVFFAAWEAGGC